MNLEFPDSSLVSMDELGPRIHLHESKGRVGKPLILIGRFKCKVAGKRKVASCFCPRVYVVVNPRTLSRDTLDGRPPPAVWLPP